jgi:hypothetical protein
MKSPIGFWTPVLVIVVVILWSGCFAVSWCALKPEDIGKIAPNGQFGDVFGAVNWLFTGLALIGLARTIYLQRKQTAAQEQQLADQKNESGRQAREQFLTVRLNAQVAALQAALAQVSALASRPKMNAEKLADMALRNANRIGIAIEILSLEASQIFNDAEGKPSTEKECMRQFIVRTLQEFVVRCDEH